MLTEEDQYDDGSKAQSLNNLNSLKVVLWLFQKVTFNKWSWLHERVFSSSCFVFVWLQELNSKAVEYIYLRINDGCRSIQRMLKRAAKGCGNSILKIQLTRRI